MGRQGTPSRRYVLVDTSGRHVGLEEETSGEYLRCLTNKTECPECSNDAKNLKHVFRDCTTARQVRQELNIQWSQESSVLSYQDWVAELFQNGRLKRWRETSSRWSVKDSHSNAENGERNMVEQKGEKSGLLKTSIKYFRKGHETSKGLLSSLTLEEIKGLKGESGDEGGWGWGNGRGQRNRN
ncbi:hypothetical protein Gorai_009079 [Gossypium raimondii]|uniref:Reverse transcriptase zinc-binding domain-containing protein n=1 Tax=Gossypium raimondii TaxID=29730 RepID=A0A7J8PTA0_GOSRA|nr:hypothetical protein [Gossypium raimondii]